AKERAVPRSEQLGAGALGAARQFVRAAGSGRGVKIADDTIVAQTAKKVAEIRGDAELNDTGKQNRLAAVGVLLQQQVAGVLGKIATAREEQAPGPAPSQVRLGDDPLLSHLFAYGTAQQVVAALDCAH